MKRIDKIQIVRHTDTDPDSDLSFLGTYSNTPGPDDKTIDRQARGDMERSEYRYFVAANSAKDTGNPQSVDQDYARMEAYNHQGWCMMGVSAQAIVETSDDGKTWTRQLVKSGGLWGIESDSDASYFREVAEEQLATLTPILVEFGFTDAEITAAHPASLDPIDEQ